ncbi:MAG: hypothetical protein HYY18_08690, partial [Planctomycetes bacterium]|nr:hypothetical protein [Planctomycetota bacterium]
PPDPVTPEAIRRSLETGFDRTARRLNLDGLAIYWNRGTRKAPDLISIGSSGAAADLPASEVSRLAKALQEGEPSYGSRTTGVHEALTVEVTFPLSVDGDLRAIARFILPGRDWNAGKGLIVAGALERWVGETCAALDSAAALAAIEKRRRSEEEAFRAHIEKGIVTDTVALREALRSGVEGLRERLRLPGLSVFWVDAQQDLEVLLSSGTGPQTSTAQDREVVRAGTVSHPEGLEVTQVSMPIVVRAGTGSRVVAVAHFQVPPPPPKGGAARAFLIAMIGIMALVLGVLFFYMNQAISLPIQRLIGAMARGTEGDLQPIAENTAGSGEVSWLAGTFNRLVQKLKLSDAENRKLLTKIQGFNAELKSKLEQRTRELESQSGKLLDLERKVAGQERLTALGQLAGTLAHELGTPLNAMGGHLELLLTDENALHPEVAKRLRLIGGQIDRLSSVIQKTLHQLRTPAPQFKSVDLNALAQGIVTLVSPSLATRKVAIRMSLAAGLPSVSGDPEQLEQVLMNLVNNALDAMPGGGSLDLLTSTLDGSVCLQVRDTGVGIPKEDLPHIFAAFYTTKRPGKGTGLGLTIVDEIVKRHHGTIDVQSETCKGSWFTLRFPPEVSVDGAPKAPAVPEPREAAR